MRDFFTGFTAFVLTAGGIALTVAAGDDLVKQKHHIAPEMEAPYIVDTACKFANAVNGTRQAYCQFIYSDNSVDEDWQLVTIEDGLIVAIVEESE